MSIHRTRRHSQLPDGRQEEVRWCDYCQKFISRKGRAAHMMTQHADTALGRLEIALQPRDPENREAPGV